MTSDINQLDHLTHSLRERVKELTCLYAVERILKDYQSSLENRFTEVLKVLPSAFQFPEFCRARIQFNSRTYSCSDVKPTKHSLAEKIAVEGQEEGVIEIYYDDSLPQDASPIFLTEEFSLVKAVAGRLEDYIQQKNLRTLFSKMEKERQKKDGKASEWRIALNLLRKTDRELFGRVSRKMLNYLCRGGFTEAHAVYKKFSNIDSIPTEREAAEDNQPRKSRTDVSIESLADDVFDIAGRTLSDDTIMNCIQRWMLEDRASFSLKTLTNQHSSIAEIKEAVRRIVHLDPFEGRLTESTEKGLIVALIRRLITNQVNYIKKAKDYIGIKEFHELAERLIFPSGGHGLIGGKGAGLFLAMQVLRKAARERPILANIKSPKTWYLTSDGITAFMHYNNLEDMIEQKYKDIDQVRQEYPHIIELFKHSKFMPEIVQGLSMALDDLGERPIIVRSSSLLEDSLEAAFSGKYKSLFLANQGTKEERLAALLDAVAEVYSSTFGADPILYRAERSLIDLHEEMGVMIQEVIGKKIGPYFFPSYSGVAFSNNEFKWSSRIKRDDGLIRLVMGLGTRAVDRTSDDYPVIVAPGQPGLRINVTADEIMKYSPSKMDVINLQTRTFETVDIKAFLAEYVDQFKDAPQILSVLEEDHLNRVSSYGLNRESTEIVASFDGLLSQTPFIETIRTLLEVLQQGWQTAVDIEFASDGQDLYLLQCRPQCHSVDSAPSPIPKDIPEGEILFSAKKHISNGRVGDITHVVYVDPIEYGKLRSRTELLEVGRAISEVNILLPRRQFVLMGPGRWGSRGDIKLGVNVTYSDINNTAVLIEIARRKGNYLPDLSFGTHFFQDLVESSIRYIPLYPDDPGIIFNDNFLTAAPSIFSQMLPAYSHLSQVIRVIDIGCTGKVLKILMNADLDEAVAFFSDSKSDFDSPKLLSSPDIQPLIRENHWQWRLRMAESIARRADAARFGLKAFYVIGSAKNGTAGPASDIDLLLHVDSDNEKRGELTRWLEGWSQCLDEMNYLKTGYRCPSGLIDVHYVTDEDIVKKTSFAVKIGAVTDAALKIPINDLD